MDRSWLRVLTILVLLALVAVPAEALHPYYEQNGDCYVLICDGPYRGVYALNNLSGGSVQKLWNLKDTASRDLDAYGIAAAQSWDGRASQKRLYVFAGIDTGWAPWSGMISRKVIVWPDPSGRYTTPVDRIIHRYHSPGRPGDSPTGRGNHCASDYCRSLPNIFGGTCYPCSIIPAPTPGKPGYYDVPAGRWFHCLDHPVWSPYTYGWGSGGGGGWVHYVCRENVLAKFRDIKLHMLNRNTGGIDPSPYPTNVANVKTGEKSTIDQRGECVDGCIRAVDGLTGPSGEIPYLDCAYSSIGKTYLYRREPLKTEYSLLGMDGNTTIVGDPSNLTTTSIGVSSKNMSGDFVYAVGTSVINSWLRAAGAPYSIATLTDFAVSDQWWQTGGIAYVYDKTQRTVYKFVRNDLLGTTPIPEQINVGLDGILPDSIGADGFGHLYLMKTRKDPTNISAWTPLDAYRYELYFTDFAGNRYGRAYFRQGVYKTVSKRNYYTRVTAPIAGDIVLGYNQFFRDFVVRPGMNFDNRGNWIWSSGYTQSGPTVQTDYRVEIAVINSATPPQVEGDRNGVCDVRGPLLFSAGSGDFTAAAPEADGRYRDDNVYFFEVENFPRFDTNDVNTWSGDDVDHDGRRGQFVSTIKKSSIKYYWKVIQTKDRSGGTVNNTILDQEARLTPGSYRYSASLSAGEYRIGVKTVFQFYDYDRLAPGSLAQDKESVISGLRTAVGEDSGGYSWVTFTIKGVDPNPTGTGGGIIMSGKPAGGGTYTYKPASSDTFPAPLTRPKYVIPEQETPTWSFKLRDLMSNRAINPPEGRLTVMNNPRPPIPAGIARIVPNSNVWTPADQPAQYTWSSLLKRGSETVIDVSITTDRPDLTPAEVKRLFPVPSQPQQYTLSVTARRTGTVLAYFPTPVVYPDGTIGTDWGLPQDYPIIIQMTAVCDVIVKDQTGPRVTFNDPLRGGATVPGAFVNRDTLYGTTGEPIATPDSPPVAQPASLIFVVADNNPMGNDPTNVTFADPFHNNPLVNDLTVQHTYNARYAEFYYPTVPVRTSISSSYYRSNPVQNNNTNAAYKLQQQDLVEANFGTGDLSWLPRTNYHRAFSYRMYKIALTDLVHFSDQGAPLKHDLANNVSSYRNLVYGLVAKDASPAGLSSSNPNEYLGRGEIVIRDNDRPNAFIQAQDLKHEGVVHVVPSNLSAALLGQWLRISTPPTSDATRNGLQSWTGTNIGSIDTGRKVSFTLPVSTVLTTPKAEFEIDVPVFFHPIHNDNMGQTTVNTFSLLDLDGVSVLDNRPTGEDIRYLFRRPTTATAKYRVRLRVSDNARGWPSDPRRPFDTAVSNASTQNMREVELVLDVYSSKLDIRVIDRTNQGK
ncbi:MAG TPA: hypothetical protein PLP29_11125 [Candidatus Ozemobacteraceae bacterium]|nr:hypothetical protein [Candidatus Ozemobacteraceae bacterium]